MISVYLLLDSLMLSVVARECSGLFENVGGKNE